MATSDWIEHDGGAWPLSSERIVVRYRDGFESLVPRPAVEYKGNARHEGNEFDLIAYRVVSA